MKIYLNNKDYVSIREFDSKILTKEMMKRKSQNKNRLDKLKSLEEKLINEVERMTGFSELDNNRHKFKSERDKILDLNLINVNKGEGFSILTSDEVNEKFHQHKFCDYIFYTKKCN